MKRRSARTVPVRVPYAFLTPAAGLFLLFMVAPIGYTVYLSLRRVRVSGLGPGRSPSPDWPTTGPSSTTASSGRGT
jgi:ABC-type sugar transport system permease subunit